MDLAAYTLQSVLFADLKVGPVVHWLLAQDISIVRSRRAAPGGAHSFECVLTSGATAGPRGL